MMATSCYITPVDEERQREAKIKLTKNEKIIIECFTQLWGEHIGKPCPSAALGSQKVEPVDHFRG